MNLNGVRPFLRGREFLWQEGHTIHATEEEARAETLQMLEVYADCCEKMLAMPVIRGNKTEKEKFAGAVNTYTIECMMHDHKALQSGTSHYFGDGFTKAFNITFTDKENKLCYPHQTSWGLSTRVIGGIIMTHGDNSGLVLPPNIAPIQVIVVPVAQHKEGVVEKASELLGTLKKAGIRARMDDSDNSMGWKCSQWEMKGVPLRIEIGPRDIENGVCMAVRRDNGEKVEVKLSELTGRVPELLDTVQQGLFDKAKANLESHIYAAHSLEEAKKLQEEHGGFIKTMWCGDVECEERMKDEAGMSSRCIPFAQEDLGDVCPICGRPAKKMIYWGVAY
jgi:prolyl-tRNA synthetase